MLHVGMHWSEAVSTRLCLVIEGPKKRLNSKVVFVCLNRPLPPRYKLSELLGFFRMKLPSVELFDTFPTFTELISI